MATGRDSDEEEFEFSYSDEEMSQAEAVEPVEEKVKRLCSWPWPFYYLSVPSFMSTSIDSGRLQRSRVC